MHRRVSGDEEAYRICVGEDDSTRYYLDRFENFDLGGVDGMVLIIYGKQADPKIANSTLSFRPVPLDDGRIAWSCGYFQASERDTVYGTNIDAEYLPSECQARSP